MVGFILAVLRVGLVGFEPVDLLCVLVLIARLWIALV